MKMKMSRSISWVILLLQVLLTVTHVIGMGAEARCRCIETESKPIGRHIETLQVVAASSHCPEVEIIATLKQSRREVCLNPNAPWVMNAINRFLNRNKT